MLLAGCAQPIPGEAPACPRITEGTILSVREADTVLVVSGVGYVVRVDTVVLKAGLVMRLLECGGG